jgi:hypothetical protein
MLGLWAKFQKLDEDDAVNLVAADPKHWIMIEWCIRQSILGSLSGNDA